ncbi:MAG: hypothetical protein WD356_09340 [Pseudomonadales bacterium]
MDREKIERSLGRKGFDLDNRDHRYYLHKHNGKETGVKTKLSHGKKYKRLDANLQSVIKRQLKLDSSSEFRDFVECPMSADDYLAKLRDKGIIP